MQISRSEAQEKGKKFYFTGAPCKMGHISHRRTTNCFCYECEKLAGEKSAIYKKQWYEKNKTHILKKAKDGYEKIRDQKIAYACKYQKNNLSKIVKQRSERLLYDDAYRIKERIRGLIKSCLKSSGTLKNTKTAAILGCTNQDFKAHIEKQFTKGMGWHNFSQWHIDHIVPISSAKTEQDVIALNHFTNLRPLWASDNLKKSNKMEFII